MSAIRILRSVPLLATFVLCSVAGPLVAVAAERTIGVAIADASGSPLTGLVPQDVAVIENGVAREVTAVSPDKRPLTLALLADTSEAVGTSYRLNLVAAFGRFAARLPEGSRIAVWGTGDRPVKIVDWTTDPREIERPLKRVAPQGGSTLLDAIVEAARDLKTKEGERNALVVVTGTGIDFSNVSRDHAVEEASKNLDLFYAVQFQEGGTTTFDVDYTLDRLTSRTGGTLARPLSALAVGSALDAIAADLRTHQHVTYRDAAEAKDRKIAVTLARPGARARVLGGAR